ncbi:hypothetical protein BR10RB9215_C20627 [Brucella sp. 10RB9215]|uniref:hypothetical protein n=1 Tax=Brucella sp. 10RB9215 TaxID=1149953 RepID=UPI00090AEFC3|nr:hypothetical protein [Brucella sp. 10RB9215]SBW15959.1 hypothetical protein BR10RB9215_C20627 [Brucella sp. 10RB9215]
MQAMYRLLLKKYRGGKITPNQMIAGNMGWTPGNYQAAANVARYTGIGPDDDIRLTDPASAARFMRGLMRQEHGNSSSLYSDDMIRAAIGGNIPQGGFAPVSGYTPPVRNVDVATAAPQVSAPAINPVPVSEQPRAFTPPTPAGQLSPDAAAAMFSPEPTPGAVPFVPSSSFGEQSMLAGLLSGLGEQITQGIKQANYQPPEQKPVDVAAIMPEFRQVAPTIEAPQPTPSLGVESGLAEVFQKLQNPPQPIGSKFRPSRLI